MHIHVHSHSHNHARTHARTNARARARPHVYASRASAAGGQAKPNGLVHLRRDSVDVYLCDLSVRELPGVGWQLAKKLEAAGSPRPAPIGLTA